MEQCSICLESLDAAKAFGLPSSQVSLLIKDPAKATEHARETFEARPARASPPKKRERPAKRKAGSPASKREKKIEGATQKANGKWTHYTMFPGREFESLDEFRAAKKQRSARRAAWSAQARDYHG